MNPKINEQTTVKTNIELKEPSQYKVILMNDDYTTKDFVTEILKGIFNKSNVDAIALMEKVHALGSAEVGIYTYDIGSTKISMTMRAARKEGFPLQCKLEEC